MVLQGRCHCGNVRFALDWSPDPGRIPARTCGCTFCRKHGASWTSHPAGSLRVTVQDPARVERYAFGTHTADFHVCTRCGVVPLSTSRIEGRDYAVVNVNTLEGLDAAIFDRSGSDFDGEATSDRLARRQSRWIADVRFD
jgi:hypothetical protein